MKILTSQFPGIKIFKSINFNDSRGYFKEIYKNKYLKKKIFVFSCASSSNKHVLRGLHLQTKFPQGKYVYVLKGKILDVAVDLRKKSKTYGKHFKIILSRKNARSIYIPEGFAHGFLALDKENIVSYMCTNYRSKNNEVGIFWNDKDLNIKWQIKKPILSTKDKKNISFKDFNKFYI